MKVRRGDPCTIEDCDKPVVGRGWCSMHYARWRTYGDPLYRTRRYARQPDICVIDGCETPPQRRGLCHMHARRIEVRGEPTDPRERRFWAQVTQRGPDDCWPWTGYMQPNGYGTRSAHRRCETRLAHRIAYQLVVGPIPDGLVLDHLCHTRDPDCADNANCPHRRCVNPAHLEPVTRRENIARGRGGDSWGYVPEVVLAKPKVEKPTVCTEGGCDRSVFKRTICRPHYRKWLKDPEVERPSQRTPAQRFWAKVQKTPTCWLWAASVNAKTGYGQFGVRHGVMVGAHVYSYGLANGAVPAGHDVHHRCLNRRCVNPEHLSAVTRSENLRLRANRRS